MNNHQRLPHTCCLKIVCGSVAATYNPGLWPLKGICKEPLIKPVVCDTRSDETGLIKINLEDIPLITALRPWPIEIKICILELLLKISIPREENSVRPSRYA